ncbi:MAG: MmgE/PrpD family protein [Mycobacteriales bacterium]
MTMERGAPLADRLAVWAHQVAPEDSDLELAHRSLVDTVAVALAAREHPVTSLAAQVLDEGPLWAAAGHVLDFDDLHTASTTHISVVCVPTALACGGDARAYLAGAGVMARLGTALGWQHYASGWHATCTAGAPAAAVAASVALGLTPQQTATALALAVPAAGGVQRAFGTDAKSLQVAFVVDAGIRAARLAAAGARADHSALDVWLDLMGGSADSIELPGPTVPGGLATKLSPCCYALQRPIGALAQLAATGLDPARVRRIVVRTLSSTVVPLSHHRPSTGLQGKFSLEYAAAVALLDRHPGFSSFSDAAVNRPEAQRLTGLVEVELAPGGHGLLDGELEAEVHLLDGTVRRARHQYPPGSPQVPATHEQLDAKLQDCVRGLSVDATAWTWGTAADVLRAHL